MKTAKKSAIRQQMLQHRRALSAVEADKASVAICQRAWQCIAAEKAETLHTYLPINREVNTLPLVKKCLEEGVTVVVPKTLPGRQLQHLVITGLTSLKKGVYGTLYPQGAPVFTGTPRIILVPGVAFDRQRNRLGYGGGYYDSFLQQHPGAITLGLGYHFQLIDKLPVEPHDVPLAGIATELEML